MIDNPLGITMTTAQHAALLPKLHDARLAHSYRALPNDAVFAIVSGAHLSLAQEHGATILPHPHDPRPVKPEHLKHLGHLKTKAGAFPADLWDELSARGGRAT